MSLNERRTVRLAVQQPGYHRYCGYFYKMLLSDIFISLDTVQYVSREWQNRQRFHHNGLDKWLSVPVNHGRDLILRKRVVDARVVTDHWRFIAMVYGKTPYFIEHQAALEDLYYRKWIYLNDLCDALTLYARGVLGIESLYIRDSANNWRNQGLKKSDVIIDAIHRIVDDAAYDEVIYLPRNAPIPDDFYLNKKYDGSSVTEAEKFATANIDLRPYLFRHPVYRQHQYGADEPFVANLSIFDLIFNCGEDSASVLTSGGDIHE